MYIFWTILGISFLLFDIKKRSVLNLSLAATFLFCAVVAQKFPQNYIYQFSAMLGFFGLFYGLIKAVLTKECCDLKKEKALGNFIGDNAIVVKDIGKTLSIDGIGYIKYKNETWQAKSINDKQIKAGQRVKIISKENKIMNVEVVK